MNIKFNRITNIVNVFSFTGGFTAVNFQDIVRELNEQLWQLELNRWYFTIIDCSGVDIPEEFLNDLVIKCEQPGNVHPDFYHRYVGVDEKILTPAAQKAMKNTLLCQNIEEAMESFDLTGRRRVTFLAKLGNTHIYDDI